MQNCGMCFSVYARGTNRITCICCYPMCTLKASSKVVQQLETMNECSLGCVIISTYVLFHFSSSVNSGVEEYSSAVA